MHNTLVDYVIKNNNINNDNQCIKKSFKRKIDLSKHFSI